MKYKLLRTKFLLPISDKLGRNTRISDGLIFIEDQFIKYVGEFNIKQAQELLDNYSSNLEIVGVKNGKITKAAEIPQINGVALPGFVKAHGHDHESPIIGIAKDVSLTEWLDSAVNIFTGFLHTEEERLTEHFQKSPYFLTYLKARIDDI